MLSRLISCDRVQHGLHRPRGLHDVVVVVVVVMVMVTVMVIVMGRMMVSLGMRTMVVSAVSIAGQEADQNQGQAPTSKAIVGTSRCRFEATTAAGTTVA